MLSYFNCVVRQVFMMKADGNIAVKGVEKLCSDYICKQEAPQQSLRGAFLLLFAKKLLVLCDNNL